MPKVDLESIEQVNRTGYPPPFDQDVAGRWYRRLAPATGLTDFGASHVVLKPGAWSSQRHWHDGEDEFLVMLSGEAVLVEDEGRTILRAGDIAAWPKGTGNGHHLRNESERTARSSWSAEGRIPAAAIPTSTCCSLPTTATSTRTDRLIRRARARTAR